MKLDFSYFVNIIPQDMYSRTKAHICKYMAIFEPEDFVLGEAIRVDDYHFLLFFSEAPVTKINNFAYKPGKESLLVIQPWEEVFGVPDDVKKSYEKYIHIAVEKNFFKGWLKLRRAEENMNSAGSIMYTVSGCWI